MKPFNRARDWLAARIRRWHVQRQPRQMAGVAGWELHWNYFVRDRLMRQARGWIASPRLFDYLLADITYGDILRHLQESGRPHQILNLDPDSGAVIPPTTYVKKRGRLTVEGGVVVVDPGTLDAMLFTHVWSACADQPELLAFAARSEPVLQLIEAARAAARGRIRREERIQVVPGPDDSVGLRARWEDLVLPPGMAEDIRRNVTLFFSGREMYKKLAIPHRRGFLFVGPPGNGKTSICSAIGALVDVPFVYVAAGPLDEKVAVRRAFHLARELAPAVLCVEDIDALGWGGRGLTQLLNELDGLRVNDGVLTIATSNRPEAIDPALSDRPSRFDRVWWIGDPDARQRRELLTRYAPGVADLEEVVALSEGLSMASVKEVAVSAAYLAIDCGLEGVTRELLKDACLLVRRQSERARKSFQEREPVGFVRPTNGEMEEPHE